VSRSRQLHRVRRRGAEPNAALRVGVMVREGLPTVPPGGPRLTMLSITDLFGVVRAQRSLDHLKNFARRRSVRRAFLNSPSPAGVNGARPRERARLGGALMIRRWIPDRGVERAVLPVLLAQQFSRDMFGVIAGSESFGEQPALHIPNADHAASEGPSSFDDRSATLFRGRLD
jgi:hypothetical protein